jgi:hypothetical protein
LVLEFVSVLAVIVNCGFLAVHVYAARETFLPHYSLMFKFVLIVLGEHALLALKAILALAIEDEPSDVRLEKAKEALKSEEQNLRLLHSPTSSAVFKKKRGF